MHKNKKQSFLMDGKTLDDTQTQSSGAILEIFLTGFQTNKAIHNIHTSNEVISETLESPHSAQSAHSKMWSMSPLGGSGGTLPQENFENYGSKALYSSYTTIKK